SLSYEIKFPIGAHPGNAAYEIDKTNMRFVAGGARVPQDEVLSDDEADRLRAAFKERVEAKRKWTDAVETELICDDFSLRKIVNATSQMVQGKLPYIREYLETSQEAEIFLHGIESWEISQHYSSEEDDEDGEEASAEDNTVKTSGTTALHMAACEAYPQMVKLLLSKGADANAADVEGRTALMEAALWGRLENVEVLLGYGADKSLTCVEGNRLLRAVDFANPLGKNAQSRRARAGGGSNSEPIYKEDTYARDRDRRDIVRLLNDAADEPSFPQLDGFAFWRPLGDDTALSLTTQYGLPSLRKTVARMSRDGGLPEVSAMSGWSHLQSESFQVAGRDWTDE
ncbi:hypothetical protein BGZ61DRAFT_316041, partial [Ilyonectria robusta]|uniref:uncharacterized protein n=1 Tax=Ilyonectria robusta TaxID=1079257 RepID=UPI001E8E1368